MKGTDRTDEKDLLGPVRLQVLRRVEVKAGLNMGALACEGGREGGPQHGRPSL
ncbi:hypothetical protein GCM10022415_27040 [Knoellia locipacati]|uniref:Uncharacterized protein n=1 Tax=Knoellia locipacati TaxID=882824 RepID=A0A512T375_9MICO|nr:hypothetical protein KLO01_27010 [Knoellia locipacati]